MAGGDLPVYMRVGSGEEHQIGVIALGPAGGAAVAVTDLAGLLRAGADALEAEAAGPGRPEAR